MTATREIDLRLDLNTMDETGLPWSFLDEARHPERVIPGSYIIVGSGDARAVALVVDVTVDGVVHVQPRRGTIAENADLLSQHPLAS